MRIGSWKKAMFESGKCPMMNSDIVDKYKLTNEFIKRFCDKGCSVDCGQFLKEELEKRGLIQIEGQMSLEDFPKVMP